MAELEAQVARLHDHVSPGEDRDRRLSTLSPPPPQGPAVPPPPSPSAQPVEMRSSPVESETLLKWGGIGLVVLAIGFAVSTAIQRGWIGPLVQLGGAIAIALGFVGAGLRLRTDRQSWAHALCSGGVAALLVTFASDLFLQEATVESAYVVTLVVALGGLGLSRVVPSEWVAAVALAGGVLGWLAIADGSPPFIESGAALVVGLLAVVVVAVERGWVGLRLLAEGIGAIGVLAFAMTATGTNEQVATVVAAGVVAPLLLLLPNLGDPSGLWRELELRVPMVLGPWLWVVLVALFFDDDGAPGWVALAVAGAVALLGFVGRVRLLIAVEVALLVGASVCLTSAFGILLSTETAWLAIAVQGVGLLALARTLEASRLMGLNAALLLVLAAVFAAVDGVDAWTLDTDLAADAVRLGVVGAVGAGVWLAGLPDLRRVGAPAVLVLVLIWLGSVLVHLPEGQALVSLSWATVGIGILVVGATQKRPKVGTVGLAVLALTVGKLLLVDMAEVDTLWRAGLFLIVGLALLRLGFLLPRLTAANPDPDSAAVSD